MFNKNELLILSSICNLDDDNDNKGMIRSNGIKISELVDKTNLCYGTIYKALNSFVVEGLVEYGLKDKQAKTYVITEKGFKEIEKCISEDDV